MTDEQIIKALECCTSQDGSHPCTDCPCWDDDKSDCNGLDWKDVASLVNRQKAEIDRLTTLEEKEDEHCREVCEPHFRKTITRLEVELKAMRGAANSYKAEVERLTLEYAGFKAGVKHFADIGKMYSEVRAEAIREFAERLKRKSYITKPYAFLAPKDTKFEMVDVCDIDNLVKEMTEGQP